MQKGEFSVQLREIDDSDLVEVHGLNQANVPEVGDATLDHLRTLIDWSHATVVAVDAGVVVGFVVVIGPGTPYTSPNYSWFDSRGDDFLYVDRVAVDVSHRGEGIGGALYDRVEQLAIDAGMTRVTCEVNVRPRNDRSLDFHEARGFVPVGEQETYGGTIRVRLMEKRLADPLSA